MTKASGAADPAATSARRDIVVIGGSAGALDPMIEIVKGLPQAYPGALFIVSHIGAHPSQLPALLAKAGQLPAAHPQPEEKVRCGHVYVAPPDRHLLLTDHRMLLSLQPREHFTRPAIDPLFRSAARAYGARVVGVLLSGTGSDGVLGLECIQRAGGLVVVQDPAEAAFPEMPSTALRIVQADFVVPSAGIAELLVHLAAQPLADEPTGGDAQVTTEADMEGPIALTCPECGGAVREIPGTGLVAYRCHTGHRFNADELLSHLVGDVERAVMVAIRVLHERIALCCRMIDDAKTSGRVHGLAYWTRLKEEADAQLSVLQRFLHTASTVETAEPRPSTGFDASQQ